MAKKIVKKSLKKLVEKPEKVGEDKVKKIKIRVIGVGGGAGNIVAEIGQKIKKASFAAADTDLKSLRWLSNKIEKFNFGQHFTRGMGTGMKPDVGEEAAKSEKERIKKLLEGQDFVILIGSLGGGVGSGAAPVFSKIARSLGSISYGIFTLPFKFEGEKKMDIAVDSLRKLKENLNAFSIIPNERIFQIVDKNTPLKEALSKINRILADGIEGLIDIIYSPGLINIDFADIKTVFEGIGKLTYLNSIEIDKKEEKEPFEKVIKSPLYPYGIEGAKGVLFDIAGQKDLSLSQVSQISNTISSLVNPEAKIIFGISRFEKDSKIKVSLLATGCSKKIFSEKAKKQKRKAVKTKEKKLKAKTHLFPKKKSRVKRVKIEVSSGEKVSPGLVQGGTAPTVNTFTTPKNRAAKWLGMMGNKVRKNAIQIKNDSEKEEEEMEAKERFWETPAFLRKKIIKEQ